MSVPLSVPWSSSSTSSGFYPRQRVLRSIARFGATGVVAAVLVALGAAPSRAATTTYDPATDPYSMANTTAIIGAPSWWNAGYTGAGVDVAMIDTGQFQAVGLLLLGRHLGPRFNLL